MIDFSQFVKVIHDAALSTNQALMAENIKIITKYFDRIEIEEENPSIDEAAIAAKKVLVKGDANEEELRKHLQKLTDANEATRNKQKENKHKSTYYRPKMVSVQYPQATADGVVIKDVNVPLLTLVPISMSEVSEIKFKTHLEIIDDDEQLKVSFPGKDHKSSGNGSDHLSSLEITIRPHECSAGLTTLIEGYEKVLRAQIPH